MGGRRQPPGWDLGVFLRGLTVDRFLTAVEPLFTFEARIPPAVLRELTARQIRAHLLWYEANRGPLEFDKIKG